MPESTEPKSLPGSEALDGPGEDVAELFIRSHQYSIKPVVGENLWVQDIWPEFIHALLELEKEVGNHDIMKRSRHAKIVCRRINYLAKEEGIEVSDVPYAWIHHTGFEKMTQERLKVPGVRSWARRVENTEPILIYICVHGPGLLSE